MNEASSLESFFGDMPDPRVIGRCEYKLMDIILIAICAVLSGAEGWEDIEEFGQSKEGRRGLNRPGRSASTWR